MSLYRDYRPLSFADVVGQDAVVTTLEQASKLGKLSHAYLFAGSRGTGKTSIARILAKEMMTRGMTDETLKRKIIEGIEDGSIVDLLEIDAASNRGIDDIRDLVEKIQFSPVVAKAKVYIIDEVHMLTKEAFNALLKTLEEPPEYAYFILATTELNKIPATIQSRCQCFPFRRIREEDLIRRLQFIADQEHITIDRDALRVIASHVQGGMRDAISLLDQVRSLEKITVQDIERRIGSTGLEHVKAVFEALEEQDSAALLERIHTIEESGIPIDSFLRQLLSVVRARLHEAIQEKQSTVELLFLMDTLLEAVRDVRIAPLPGLVLESALLNICTKQDVSEKKAKDGSMFAKLKEAAPVPEAKEQKQELTTSPQEEKPLKAASKPEEQKGEPLAHASIEAPELSLESLKVSWPTVLQETAPASVRMSLKMGHLSSVQQNKIVIQFSSAFHRDKVREDEASRAIEAVLQKIFKQTLRLECTLGEEESQIPSSSHESVNLADAAAEIF